MAQSLVRVAVVILTSLTCAYPPCVSAAPAEPATVADVEAFEAGFMEGDGQYKAGEFLEAARTWTEAADFLTETAEHRHNRESIHFFIARAYKRSIEAGADASVVREAHSVLAQYADGCARAYPGEPLEPQVAKALEQFKNMLSHEPSDEPEVDTPLPPPPSPSPARPWKGLAIGGGVATGAGAAMLVMFVAGLARARSADAKFDAPARMCDPDALMGKCQQIFDEGTRAEAVARAGLITAPLLLGAGIAMLVVSKRRKSSHQALVPALGPAMTGLVWERRF